MGVETFEMPQQFLNLIKQNKKPSVKNLTPISEAVQKTNKTFKENLKIK